jgi:DNA replication protein DnaC
MTRRKEDANPNSQLDRDLAELKLLVIAKAYREILDEAARKGSSLLEVLRILIGMEATARNQRALERRLREARLPKRKTLEEYDFTFPTCASSACSRTNPQTARRRRPKWQPWASSSKRA